MLRDYSKASSVNPTPPPPQNQDAPLWQLYNQLTRQQIALQDASNPPIITPAQTATTGGATSGSMAPLLLIGAAAVAIFFFWRHAHHQEHRGDS